MNFNINSNGVPQSQQVSKLGAITAGTFQLDDYKPFLIKNVTDENISVSIRLANMSAPITTVLYPGWNPELVIEVIGAVENQLQYGN